MLTLTGLPSQFLQGKRVNEGRVHLPYLERGRHIGCGRVVEQEQFRRSVDRFRRVNPGCYDGPPSLGEAFDDRMVNLDRHFGFELEDVQDDNNKRHADNRTDQEPHGKLLIIQYRNGSTVNFPENFRSLGRPA